jgi:pimeloyl-ACP methyl ester carboxylesterase
MGIVLYAPAMDESPDEARPVAEIVEGKGDEFRFLQFDWSKTIDDWVRVVEKAYAKCDPTGTEIISRSLGSVAALVATARMTVQPKRLVLLSLSARFREDFPNLPQTHTVDFTDAQREGFERLCFNELAPQVACPTLLMIGDLEYIRLPTLAVRVHKADELIPCSQLVVANEAGHALYYPGYQEALAAHL